MVSGTACGLLLLLIGGLSVALAMNTCPRLALLALGLVPLLVTLLAPNKTLVVLVPMVPLYFHPSGLGSLACVVFVSSIALQLCLRRSQRSSVTPRWRFAGMQHGWPQSQLGPVVAGL